MNQAVSGGYTSERAREIVERINNKGWAVYDSTDIQSKGADACLAVGPVSAVEQDRRYVLMPVCSEPNNPDAVFGALEKFALANERQSPTIIIRGEREPWTGFIPLVSAVKVNALSGPVIAYERFVEALETITASTLPKL